MEIVFCWRLYSTAWRLTIGGGHLPIEVVLRRSSYGGSHLQIEFVFKLQLLIPAGNRHKYNNVYVVSVLMDL